MRGGDSLRSAGKGMGKTIEEGKGINIGLYNFLRHDLLNQSYGPVCHGT